MERKYSKALCELTVSTRHAGKAYLFQWALGLAHAVWKCEITSCTREKGAHKLFPCTYSQLTGEYHRRQSWLANFFSLCLHLSLPTLILPACFIMPTNVHYFAYIWLRTAFNISCSLHPQVFALGMLIRACYKMVLLGGHVPPHLRSNCEFINTTGTPPRPWYGVQH